MRARGIAAVAALAMVGLLGLLGLLACGGGGGARHERKQETPVAPSDAASKVTEEGPVKATVKVWPTAPALGDPIHLELTIEAQPGVLVAAPFESERLGRFTVAGWNHETRRRDDGVSIEVQRYTLQAPGSGKHRVPPIRLEVTDAGAVMAAAPSTTATAGTATTPAPTTSTTSTSTATSPTSPTSTPPTGPKELFTEEIPISVAMVDQARATQDLAPARGALDASTRDYTPLWIVAIVVGLLVAAGGALLGLRGVRRARDRRARIGAYEDAVRRLGELEQRGAPDEASADAWFVELSAIVRNYLEGRYQVRAPELTTEEFLQEARRAAGLSAEHRDLLTAFLERCDRVKFAGYRPDAEESLATLRAARAFVEDTRLRLQEAA
jgi:hypothetical protein